jgi:hypothetical protein
MEAEANFTLCICCEPLLPALGAETLREAYHALVIHHEGLSSTREHVGDDPHLVLRVVEVGRAAAEMGRHVDRDPDGEVALDELEHADLRLVSEYPWLSTAPPERDRRKGWVG